MPVVNIAVKVSVLFTVATWRNGLGIGWS